MKSEKINKFVSDEIKVFLDKSPLVSGHAVRGIGVYTKILADYLGRRSDVELVGDRKQADVIHYPYFDLFFNTLRVSGGEKVVVTVYDTIPLIYPKEYPVGLRGKFNFFRQKQELKKTKAIITISETSKKDIVRFLDVPSEKIFPIHLAVSENFRKLKIGRWAKEVRERYNLPEKFILYVGDVNYNKNVLGLIRAFAQLPSTGLGLVLAGKAFGDDIPETRGIIGLIEELKLQDRVVMPGFVSEEDLVCIYNLAAVYCQPSFYEGFGLPVLEAMACGIPVVAAKTQALVEIAEGEALFADSHDPKELASALVRVLSDAKLQANLRKVGLEHVKKFSWEKVADETIAIYKNLASPEPFMINKNPASQGP